MPEQVNGFFPDAAKFTLASEGGYSDDPEDTPTNYGIRIETLSLYRGRSSSVHDVQNLQPGDAVAIYHRLYWCPLSIEGLVQRSTALAIFDTAVLYGVTTAIILAQRALKSCDSVVISLDPGFRVDGHMGPITIEELNRCPERIFLAQFHLKILDHIDAIVKAKPLKGKYRRGWIIRANRLLNLIPETKKNHPIKID